MKREKSMPGIFVTTMLAVFMLELAPSAFAEEHGSVCLAPGAFDAFSKGAATVAQDEAHRRTPASAESSEAIRFVQIDRLAPVKVTSSKFGKITGIDVDGKHLIRISKRSDLKEPVTSFHFSFRELGAHQLCLWYGSFYGSWKLQRLNGSVCRCG